MLTRTEPIVRRYEFTWWGFRGEKVKKLPRASPSKIEGDPKNRGEITEFEKEWLLVALGLMYEVALGLTSAERHSAPGSL